MITAWVGAIRNSLLLSLNIDEEFDCDEDFEFFSKGENIVAKYTLQFIINSLNYAHKQALNKDVIGLINCPINKRALNKKEFGVTETGLDGVIKMGHKLLNLQSFFI